LAAQLGLAVPVACWHDRGTGLRKFSDRGAQSLRGSARHQSQPARSLQRGPGRAASPMGTSFWLSDSASKYFQHVGTAAGQGCAIFQAEIRCLQRDGLVQAVSLRPRTAVTARPCLTAACTRYQLPSARRPTLTNTPKLGTEGHGHRVRGRAHTGWSRATLQEYAGLVWSAAPVDSSDKILTARRASTTASITFVRLRGSCLQKSRPKHALFSGLGSSTLYHTRRHPR